MKYAIETLRNAIDIVSNCADLGEVLETVKVIAEGDLQSWYTAYGTNKSFEIPAASRSGTRRLSATHEEFTIFLGIVCYLVPSGAINPRHCSNCPRDSNQKTNAPSMLPK